MPHLKNCSFSIFILKLFPHLIDQQSDGCDERGVKVLSWCGHVCECSEEGDAIGAVHLTQPSLKPLLVVWVC